jgi:hypothetical protein
LNSDLKFQNFIRNVTNENYETTSCAGALLQGADSPLRPFNRGEKLAGDELEGSLSLTRLPEKTFDQ